MRFQEQLTQGLAGAAAGAGQRMMWEKDETGGWLLTGGLILGGVVGEMFFRQPLLQDLSRAATISGATIAGWVLAEKNLINNKQFLGAKFGTPDDWAKRNLNKGGQPRVGHLPALSGNGARAHILANYDVVEQHEI